ncbi:MAG: methionyl-tRNA formyltransferase [Candidatus Saccharibacteria bacterium]|nr:methionyl-tRNA formyltransferase [Candidatus Saccharibacteria bacterium]
MHATLPKIIFFGTEAYSLVTLQTLVERGFAIAAVVTKPDAPKGRGHKLTEPPVKTFAKAHNIPVWQPSKLRDIADDIVALRPVAGVLVAYGKIIPQSIIDLFTPGIINVHPSLLPRYRGPSPIEAAIANGDRETGVSIMQLDAAMDAGPVYAQTHRPLDGSEAKPLLYDELFASGSELLADILPDILSGALTPTPQQHEAATYCQLLNKSQSLITPAAIPAAEADAHVRAHLGFPRTKITINGVERIITRAHTADTPRTDLDQRCADGRFLIIDELIAPSGKTMAAEAFLRGHHASH